MNSTDVDIIGGGISGLSALHFIKRLKPHLSIALFESEQRLGGTLATDRVDGYSFDRGPNGFLDREPLTLQLCHELGLSDQLERARDNVSNRFILRGGKLRSVPMSPQSFLTSDVLSLSGKLRVFCEPFVPRKTSTDDESIYDFGKRRIGREAADYLIQPMVSGIFGGMAERLSLKSCFPIMTEMESEYGSLTKAMIARGKKARADGKKKGSPGGPTGWLTSFHGGLDAVIMRLDERYAKSIIKGAKAISVQRANDRFAIAFANGESHSAGAVIVATPSYSAGDMVRPMSDALANGLEGIPYAPISVVCLGYDAGAVRRNLDGFGFLVPQKEKRRIMGSIWTSSIFRDRAPEHKVQFRTMIGGDGDRDSVNLSNDALQQIVCKELGDIIGLSKDPDMVRIYRLERGIPQYVIGHADRIERIENELQKLGKLYLTGNAYYGVGLNDCIKQSHRVAQGL
ncbi:MAG: protoporphyrinogen oxidase [Candidatus Zixiibacteriota bacterium]|mgnify:CR=1 FL=1